MTCHATKLYNDLLLFAYEYGAPHSFTFLIFLFTCTCMCIVCVFYYYGLLSEINLDDDDDDLNTLRSLVYLEIFKHSVSVS